jgi:feruloyl esterase
VANSNTGHDNGSEPYASFAFSNQQGLVDFAYRAVHVTANASKTLVQAYYGKPQEYAYWEGCSQGGRQGMMESQRFPDDFDGIVVGAPVYSYQRLNMEDLWSLQLLMKDKFAGNLAYDVDGDGSYKSLTKLEMLRKAVLDKCDAKDGVKDGVVSDPEHCDFNPDADLANKMCPGDKNADACFTKRQVETIKQLYAGPFDSKGVHVYPGLAYGSEFAWPRNLIPYGGNNFTPSHMVYEMDHVNFLFYEESPGIPPPNVKDLSFPLDKKAPFPEYAWWEFNIDDVTAGKGDARSKLLDATYPDLTRFLIRRNGKMIFYQGWGDGDTYPQATIDYFNEMVKTTFGGDHAAAAHKTRLFMVPGMGHCSGGPGPNEWDKLAPLAEWVEKGKAPDAIVAVYRSDSRSGVSQSAPVNNERKLCPYPRQAVYTGPAGGENDRRNWIAGNFTCK